MVGDAERREYFRTGGEMLPSDQTDASRCGRSLSPTAHRLGHPAVSASGYEFVGLFVLPFLS